MSEFTNGDIVGQHSLLFDPFRDFDDGFGHWIAGFIDGEGHFGITQNPRRSTTGVPSYAPRFALGVRDDDIGILRRIVDATKIGSIQRTQVRDANPDARWVARTKSDCRRLVWFLDKYPLRAKKQRDYAIWREAVMLWQPKRKTVKYGDRGTYQQPWQERLGELKQQLIDVRKYRPENVSSSGR